MVVVAINNNNNGDGSDKSVIVVPPLVCSVILFFNKHFRQLLDYCTSQCLEGDCWRHTDEPWGTKEICRCTEKSLEVRDPPLSWGSSSGTYEVR